MEERAVERYKQPGSERGRKIAKVERRRRQKERSGVGGLCSVWGMGGRTFLLAVALTLGASLINPCPALSCHPGELVREPVTGAWYMQRRPPGTEPP